MKATELVYIAGVVLSAIKDWGKMKICDVAEEEVRKLEKKFKQGSIVHVRVLGFRHLEGLATAKKVNLVNVGIVGGLTDGSDEREKGPPTSYYMSRAMGPGTGLGKSGFPSSPGMGGDDIFSSLSGGGGQQYQYGGFQK